MGFPGSSAGKELACNAGDPSSIPGLGRFPWRRVRLPPPVFLGFPGGSDCEESASNVGDLGWEEPLEDGMATHSSILAWRIPMDRGAWRASLWDLRELDVAKQLSRQHTHTVVVIIGWQGSKWMTLLGHILMTLLEALQWFPLHVERPPRPAILSPASFLTLLEPQKCSPCAPYSSMFQAQGSSISPSHCLRELPWWLRW